MRHDDHSTAPESRADSGPTVQPAAPAPSLAEFLSWPEQEPPSEYVAGRVVAKTPLEGPELWLRADLTALLYGWARQSRQGAVAALVRCTFDDASYVPDLVYFTPEHLPAEAPDGGGLRQAPDFAAEVCPSGVDPTWVAAKLEHFVAHGVQLAWLIDPLERTVAEYRPGVPPTLLRSGGMLDGGAVLPQFFLFLDDLFAVLDEEE